MSQPKVTGDATAVAGETWTAVVTGVAHVHSLVVDCWGANGGIFRYFPRGGDEVKVGLRFGGPGKTAVTVALRDERLATLQVFEANVAVAPRGAPAGYRSEAFWGAPMAGRPDTGAGAPAFQVVNDGPGAARAGQTYRGWMMGPTEAAVGDTVSIQFSPPSGAASVLFEAVNALVDSLGPRPAESMTEARVQMVAEGKVTVIAKALDQIGQVLEEATHTMQAIASQIRDRPVSGMGSPGAARAGKMYGGWMWGPTEAKVGDTISVQFSPPSGATSVLFEAVNAVVGSVGPMPAESTAETSVQMTSEGTATVFGTALDQVGQVLQRVTHVIKVAADKAQDRSLSDLASDMQRAMEERIRSRLK